MLTDEEGSPEWLDQVYVWRFWEHLNFFKFMTKKHTQRGNQLAVGDEHLKPINKPLLQRMH